MNRREPHENEGLEASRWMAKIPFLPITGSKRLDVGNQGMIVKPA